MKKNNLKTNAAVAAMLLSVGVLSVPAGVQASPVLNVTNFIGAPTNFNGFESIPNDGFSYTGGAGPYDEDGIRVTQIDGDVGNDIVFFLPQIPGYETEGNNSWYPNGGDHGYTDITLTSGAEISSISLIFISFGFGDIMYDVLNHGSSVLSGQIDTTFGIVDRIGFEGGGFDEIRLRSGGSNFYDGDLQALDIDSIAVIAVPEPETYAMLLAGLGLIGYSLRRRQAL